MHYKTIFIIISSALLLLLILIPSIYINNVCEKYLDVINDISFSLENNNLEKARTIYDDEIENWSNTNNFVLSLSPHEQCETIDKFLIELKYQLKQGKIEEALSYCDLIIDETEHLQKVQPLL